MPMQVTNESRSAISRAWFFFEKAIECSADQRVEFEAFLEASIIFARAAMHRCQRRFQKHAHFGEWWTPLREDSSVVFLRKERDWILKEASPQVGQIAFAGQRPTMASGFYYYDGPEVPATDTVRRHLERVNMLLAEAEERFGSR